MSANNPLWSPRTTRANLSGASGARADVAGAIFWPGTYVAPSSPAQPTLRQAYQAAGTSIAGVSVVAGDRITVAMIFGNGLDATITCSDGVNDYTPIGSGFDFNAGSPGCTANLWTAVAATTGTLTITVTSVNVNIPVMFALVHSGVGASMDGSAVMLTEGATSNTHTNSITTTNPNDLLISLWCQDSQSGRITPGPDWNIRSMLSVDGANVWNLISDRVVNRAGTFTDTLTNSSSGLYGNVLIAYQAEVASVTVTGTSAASLTITGAAQGSHGSTASSSSKALTLSGSASGSIGAVASSSAALPIGGATTATQGQTSFSSVPLQVKGSASGLQGVLATAASVILALSGTARGTQGVTGSGSAPLGIVSGSATGTQGATASSSAPLKITGSGTAAQGATASSSASLQISGYATATHGVPSGFTATSTASLKITGLASGLHGVTSSSSAALKLSGAFQGTQGATGSSSVPLTLKGSASALQGAQATSSATLALKGSVSALQGSKASSSFTLALKGSASGAQGHLATSSQILRLTGSAAGSFTALGTTGTSSAPLPPLCGQIRASVGAVGTSWACLHIGGSATGSIPHGLPQDPRFVVGDLVQTYEVSLTARSFDVDQITRHRTVDAPARTWLVNTLRRFTV